MVLVTAASAPSALQHSSTGASGGSSSASGMKWSARYARSQPVVSQWVVSAAISANGRPQSGQMLKRIAGSYGRDEQSDARI